MKVYGYTCLDCGKQFESKFKNRKYCSRQCAADEKQGRCLDCSILLPISILRCVECRAKLEEKRIATLEERKATRRLQSNKKVVDWRQRKKIKAVEYKGGKCQRCGYSRYIQALHFHHRDPEQKDFAIGKYRNMTWDKVTIELDKCDLVCSNCHSEIHADIYAALLNSQNSIGSSTNW